MIRDTAASIGVDARASAIVPKSLINVPAAI
jgi:hypothetical protein